jgi:acyl carrier protein
MTEPAVAAQERTEAQIRQTVLTVILEMAPNPEGGNAPETALVDDLGYHSLALMEVAFALEDEFDLDPIDEASARKITTVGAVQDYVVTKLLERDGADG